ncbi:S41 family peptidase [Candidatus Babeliales bacterium]|nr:S41 family peptidase [Candidatus Babeliales bacterium]
MHNSKINLRQGFHLRKSFGGHVGLQIKILASFLLSLLLIFNQITPKNKQNIEKNIYPGLELFSQTIAKIEAKGFRKKVDFLKFTQEALKAAIPSIVDAHSSFFPPKSYKATLESTSGEFSGIGVSITGKTPQDDVLVIVDVIESGPAQKTGLKSGDKIIEVDGKKLRSLSTDEVINNLLKGKVGTKVKLKIIRDKKPMEFEITREIIKDQTSLCYNFKNQNVHYLSLRMFTQKSAKQISELLKKAQKQKCNGIVLDLRRNPGGILDSAIDMSGLFLEKNSLVVTTKDREGKTISEYRTNTKPIFNSNIPIFVLIDNFTASASEILAETLRYYSSNKNIKNNNLMVFLVGTPTFGKGSVQEVIPLINGCALKLTTMLYYMPNGKSPQAKGVKPDFIIENKIMPPNEIKLINDLYGREKVLKNHITEKEVSNIKDTNTKSIKKIKTNEKEEEKSWEEKKKDSILKDNVIQSSVNMIEMLEMAKKIDTKLVETRKKALIFLKKHFLTDDSTGLEKMI